jgi:hypothetical protein
MRIQTLTFALLVAAALSRPAHAVLIASEQAIEGSTRSISLPANNNSVMVAKPCPTCAAMVLRLTPATRYVVGKTDVTLAQLLKFAATGGDHSMVLFYSPRLRTVTRLKVWGTLPATLH